MSHCQGCATLEAEALSLARDHQFQMEKRVAAEAEVKRLTAERDDHSLRAIGRRIVAEAQADTTPGSPFAARIEEAAVRVLREQLEGSAT